MSEAIPFENLPSNIPLSPVRTARRLDPLYDALWTDGTQASWIARSTADRRVASHSGKLPKHLSVPAWEAWGRFDRGVKRNRALAALGAVDTWRTVTAEQLAAITGYVKLASGRSSTMDDLFAMDLVEVGVFSDALYPGPRSTQANLYRPARPGPASAQMESSLTYPEWVSVTAGTAFEFTRQFDRHNLLATELGLRAAEFCRVGTVLGEKLSTIDALAYTGWGVQPPRPDSQRAADLTIVRRDGLRIAVEITASQGKTLEAKIGRWAATLGRRRLSDSGLVVLFVVAGRPESSSHTTAAILKQVRHHLVHSARLHPGPANDRTAARMAVVTWEDWFPSRDTASADFLDLTAEFPTGAPDNPWERVSLLDQTALPYNPGDGDPLAVLYNTSGLQSVPHWLRTRTAPAMWKLPLRRAGFDTIPHLTGLTDKGRVRSEFNAGKGPVGPAGAAPRLKF